MKNLVVLISFLLASFGLFGQKVISKTGHVSFLSETPVENIEAHNYQVASVLDIETGEIQVKLLVRSFEFKVELMHEHFNENYMESDKFPKSSLVGKISNISDVNFKKEGDYSVMVVGKLTIHGVTKPVEIPGLLTIKKGAITAKANFTVKSADYNIKIPELVKEKIAKEITVSVDIPYQKN